MTPAVGAPHAGESADVAAGLGTDAERGLGLGEARDRLAEVGPNELESGAAVRPGRILLGQLTSPMLLLLAGAGVLSAALGKAPEALVILVVVALNAWIGFRQEYRAERAMASLRAMATPTIKVLRDGAARELPAREVVPGDVVLLEAGGHVPADGRLAESHSLRVDESALTGESAPVHKRTAAVTASAPLAERTSMAYSGTSVTAGRGKLVVSATGTATELGHVADLLEGADAGRTPLQRRLDTLVKRLAVIAGVIVLLVFGLGLLRGEELDTLLLTAVSLAVAAIPESLPAVVTITLALGAQRMLARNALIRKLYAVETLGSVTTICSDKTGTLTQNRMTVVVLDTAGDRRVLEAEHPDADQLREQPTLRLLLVGGALCNDTAVADDGSLLGDPTETALVAVAERYGLSKGDLEIALPRVFELPFDSDRKRMTTVHAFPARLEDVPESLRAVFEDVESQVGLPDHLAFTKGAVDGLLRHCGHMSVDGAVVALDDDLKRRALDASERLATEGVRVLGVAMRRWPNGAAVPRDEALERGLTFVGLEGMIDPARPEVSDAIATCREAGMRAIMITGDHPLTATAIGRDLGLVGEGMPAATGAEIAELDDDQLDATVLDTSIYARVSPEHKIRIVEALQRQGQVVAMTGDGVNDAPALRQADIGVAMGITGTDVTKDAADMVLRDDNFATIVHAVREGRVVFDNIRKFIRNILSGNVAEVSVMVLAPFAGMPIPLLPLQILWLNLVTDGLPAMALAAEPTEPGVMQRPPTPLGESLLGADRGRRILQRGAALTVLTLVPAYLLWNAGDDAWRTILFTSIAFAELAGGFAMRSERVSLLKLGVFSNRALVGAVALTAALQILLVSIPFLRDLLGLQALTAIEWLLVVAIALTYLLVVELDKARQRRGQLSRPSATYARPIAVPPAQRVRLKDGCEVEIRPIEPADAQSLEEGLEVLGFESRYRRFLIPKRSFSSKELAYLTNVDHHQHEALVALEPGEGRGLAVARFVKDPDDPRTAEVAIVVADEWQDRGLGRALLERLVERAAEEGVQRFSATVLESNHDVVALLRKVGPVEHLRSDSGVTDLHVELPDGGPRSPVLEEALRAAARGHLALSHGRPDDEELHAE